MSAFIVDYKTIDNVLSIRLNHDILTNHCYLESEYDSLFNSPRGWIHDQLEELGKEFLRLNIISVEERYPNDEEMHEEMSYADNYKFKDTNCSLAQAIKSIKCLMYQSCEIENYKDNYTYQKMERLERYLTDAFLCLNDEYKQAAWSDCY